MPLLHFCLANLQIFLNEIQAATLPQVRWKKRRLCGGIAQMTYWEL